MRRVASLAFVVLLCAGRSAVGAPPPFELADDVAQQNSAERVEIMEDPTGELTAAQVTAGAGAWHLETDDNPNHGFTSSAYWARLRLRNPTSHEAVRMLVFRYPLLDSVTLYVTGADGTLAHQVSGDRIPYSRRPFASHLIEFELRVPPGATRAVYARIATTSSMQIGFELMTPDRAIQAEADDLLWRGAYYGLMVALALYNLFLYLVIRSRAYLYYVVYALMFVLVQMALDGTAGRVFFPEHPDAANTFTPLTVALLLTPPLLFAREFLETRRHVPRVHRFVNRVIAAFAIPPMLALVGPYGLAIRVAAALAVAMSILCLVLGIVVIRRGYRPARFYIIAWSAVILGTILYVLVSFGVLPANAFFSNTQRLGGMAEILLLSFALADHIALLNRERDAARAEAIALERDLAVTGAVQRLFLPRPDAFTSAALSLHGCYAPASQSGGDWWWYEQLPDGRVRVLLGDVTGHGVGAAMVTGAVAAAYRALPVATRQGDVRVVVDALNDNLTAMCSGAQHMTFGVLEVDVAAGQVRFWSAGAPAAMVLRGDGRIDVLAATGRPLGALGLVLGEKHGAIGAGDRVFVFSDGLPELDLGARELGYRGVTRMLRETLGQPGDEARARLTASIQRARGAHPQRDDIAFVVVDVHASAAPGDARPPHDAPAPRLLDKAS